jgi:hypothetical protein
VTKPRAAKPSSSPAAAAPAAPAAAAPATQPAPPAAPAPAPPKAAQGPAIVVTGPQSAIVTGTAVQVAAVIAKLTGHDGTVKADNGATITGPITGVMPNDDGTEARIQLATKIAA